MSGQAHVGGRIEPWIEDPEDPDDRAIREAHGFTYADDFEDRSLTCRNGCGHTYFDIAVCKIRVCTSADGGRGI